MPQVLIYNSSAEPPPRLADQIRTALLKEWPGPEAGVQGALLIAPELHPTYFLLVEGNQLLCYARTIWMMVVHLQQQYKLYGLGDVLTLPEYRRRGYAGRIVAEATTHIRADPEAEAAVLLTKSGLAALYRQSGWEALPGLCVTIGADDGHEARETIPMLLFLSATALATRESFVSHALILPGDEW